MIKYFLQPQLIRTVGDATNSLFIVHLGVAQGSPLSPTLFNIFIDVLARDLENVPHSWSTSPATLYADDVILLVRHSCGLQKILDICADWAGETNMIWNAKMKKSMNLFPGSEENVKAFLLAGNPLHRVTEAEYLGVTITLDGITTKKTLARVQAACSAMHPSR